MGSRQGSENGVQNGVPDFGGLPKLVAPRQGSLVREGWLKVGVSNLLGSLVREGWLKVGVPTQTAPANCPTAKTYTTPKHCHLGSKSADVVFWLLTLGIRCNVSPWFLLSNISDLQLTMARPCGQLGNGSPVPIGMLKLVACHPAVPSLQCMLANDPPVPIEMLLLPTQHLAVPSCIQQDHGRR